MVIALAMLSVVAIFAMVAFGSREPIRVINNPMTFNDRFPAQAPVCAPAPKHRKPLPRKHTLKDIFGMEIKGLAQSVARVREKIAQVRSASTDVESSAGALLSSLEDTTKQIDALHADLKFEAETLGNSGSASPVSARPSETAHLPAAKA